MTPATPPMRFPLRRLLGTPASAENESRGPTDGKGPDHDLIPAAVGAYCENGSVGAATIPRRIRLIARRRQRLDASHPIRAQSPADRARLYRGSFWRHSINECWQDEDRGGMTDRDPKLSRTLLSMQDLRRWALAEIRKQPGCLRISANARVCKSCIESRILAISGLSTFRNPHPASAR